MLILRSVGRNTFLDLHEYHIASYLKDSSYAGGVYSKLIFTVYDTDTGILSQCSLKDVMKGKPFGVVRDKADKKYVFIPISDNAWKLLDYIDSPELMDDFDTQSIDKYLSRYYGNLERHDNSDFMTQYFSSGSKTIIFHIMHISKSAEPIDSNKIFWKTHDSIYYTIFDIYKTLFKSNSIASDMDIYVAMTNTKVYKIDVNKEVVRYMTKLKTLGDKL